MFDARVGPSIALAHQEGVNYLLICIEHTITIAPGENLRVILFSGPVSHLGVRLHVSLGA